jgi:hypothetical protein
MRTDIVIFVKRNHMQLLDGKATAAQIRLELSEAVKERKQQGKKSGACRKPSGAYAECRSVVGEQVFC